MRERVNKIIPFSSVDGPGNRTAIFLQGCNIDCKYCHNPETRGICKNCGACVKVCPAEALTIDEQGHVMYDASKCLQCDLCLKNCRHNSSPKTSWMTTDQVMEKVKKQIPFIRGITVSGGECMLRPAFLTELFKKAHAMQLTTFIDSNGTIPFWEYPDLLEVTDKVMLDIKAFSNEDHLNVTGHVNDIVLKNAEFLAEQDLLYEVRLVICPDLYDTKRNVERIGEFLWPFYEKHPFHIKLISYRPMGVREQYANMAVPSSEHMKMLSDILDKKGYKYTIIL